MTALPVPSQWRLWPAPEDTLAQTMDKVVELSRTLCDKSHWWCYVLVCRECEQTYLFEFFEEVDCSGGNDAMFRTYLPVTGIEQAVALHETPMGHLHMHRPAFLENTPMGGMKRPPVWCTE